MKKSIPNILTLSNLFCGLLAVMAIYNNDINQALLLVGLGTFFDFFDGFAARMLKVSGELGKQLDSLADMVTFGVVPGFLMLHAISELQLPENFYLEKVLKFCALLITLFSALRLAKFNIDERQTTGFIGLPTPANTLFIGSLVYLLHNQEAPAFLENPYLLATIAVVSSLMLVAEIPLIALKFKNFGIKGNEYRYALISISIILAVLFQVTAVPFIILIYVGLSILENNMTKKEA